MTAEQRVRDMLRKSVQIMRDEYPEGREELLLLVFRQLSMELDSAGPDTEEEPVYPAAIH